MELHHEHLRERGWSEEEIAHAHKVLAKVRKRKHPHHRAHVEATFWALLLLATFTTVAVAYWLIPIFTIMQDGVVYPLLVIIGVSFGLLFAIVMHDLEQLERHHHVLVHACIPLAALVSFFVVAARTNTFGGELHSGLLMGLTYGVAFVAPYTYHYLHNKK